MSEIFEIDELPRDLDVRAIRPWLLQLRRAILALRPASSATVKARTTSQGTLYRAARESGGGGITPPLYLVAVDGENVKVLTGTVGGIIPTGVAADIDVSGTNGTWYIFIDATIDADGDVTAVAISSNTTGVTTDSDTHAYYLIGTVTVAASVITVVTPTLAWSQEFAACGRDSGDPSTTPGTYSFFVA